MGAGLAVANIPDVTDIPFANTVPPYLFDPLTGAPTTLNGHTIALLGPRDGGGPGSLDPGSVVTLLAIPYIGEGYGISRLFGGNGLPLPDDVVLTPNELHAIQARVGEFNAFLEGACAARGIPLVDLRTLQHRLHVEGFNLGGVQFSSRFLFGGIYSLDGIHPSDLGQALVANEWIRVINQSYGAAIPPVPLSGYVRAVSSEGPHSTAAGALSALRGIHLEHLRKDLHP